MRRPDRGRHRGHRHVAIQMAALRRARVLATARPEAANYVTSLGAAQALDYPQGDLVSAVHTLSPGGVDAVLDADQRSGGPPAHQPGPAGRWQAPHEPS